MKKVLFVVAVFCLAALGATDLFASTWTNYGGYQPPECCSDGSWNGINPAPKAINPPEFVKRIGKWNVVSKAGTSPTAQIWWGTDGTILYKIHFPSKKAASQWIKCRYPSIEQIEAAIANWPWTTPTVGLRHKWMPLSNVP